MRKRTWILAAAALLAALAATIGLFQKSRQSSAPPAIRIGVLRHESTLPVYVADELGYFTQHKVKVQLVELPPSDHMPALLADRVDMISPTSFPVLFGVMAAHPGLLYAVLPGAEVTGGQVVYGLLTRPDFKGSSVKDLRGGVVIAINPYTRVNMEMILSAAGVEKAHWPQVRVSSREAALQAVRAGKATAAIMDQPALAVALGSGGYRLLEANPRAKYVGSPYWSGAGAVKCAVWKARNTELRGVLAALDDAIKFIRDNPEAAHRILAKRLGLPLAIAKQCGGYYFPLTSEPVPEAGIDETVNALIAAGLLQHRVPLEGLFPPGLYGK
jgi:ABC-type nitrate/sulfonate/bicarbonate transport system substrate-binding protein